MEGRGLAAARFPDEREEGAGWHDEVDVPDGRKSRALVGEAYLLERDHPCHCERVSTPGPFPQKSLEISGLSYCAAGRFRRKTQATKPKNGAFTLV